MTEPNEPQFSFNDALKDRLIQDSNILVSIQENFIFTTEDKLRLGIRDHSAAMADRRAWITPASLFISIVATLCTAEFKKDFLFPASTWNAVFILVGIGSFMWMLCTLPTLLKPKATEETLIMSVTISKPRKI